MKRKICVIHGPNLNLLGQREPGIYGTRTLEEINQALQDLAEEEGAELSFFQSNHEGDIVDQIGRAPEEGFEAILINPAAYTHTSVAIRDALAAVNIPAFEVHLSNISGREDFRQVSLTAPVCVGQVSGFGEKSYLLALKGALAWLKTQDVDSRS